MGLADGVKVIANWIGQKVQWHEKLFGGRSLACDFVDLAQNSFYIRPVAPLQGLI